MRTLRIATGLSALMFLLAHLPTSALARDYPAAPVKFITQLAAGSGTDPAMRIVIDELSKRWGQQAVLVNQPGAGGAVAARVVATAPPDGSTLFMAIASTFFALPELQPNLPFNVNDFVSVGFVGEVPLAIAVTPALPIKSLPELVTYSKEQSGGMNFAVPVRGGLTHLAIELWRSRAGPNLTNIYYPGSAQAMSDVISGRVPAIIDGLAGPIVKGQLNVLAITSKSRVAAYPDTPTLAETAPGFAATGWFAVVAPRGTPDAVVKQINEDLQAVLADNSVKERFAALNVLTRPMAPEALEAFIRSEQQLWRPIVKRISSEQQ